MTSFDLATIKAKGPIAKGPNKIYTPEEIRDKLNGYTLVPKKDLESIPSGSHVRYIRSDGVFRAGGFVTCNPGISSAEKGGGLYMVLRNDIRSKAVGLVTWTVYYDDLKEVYVKNSFGSAEVDIKIKNLAEAIERTEKRMDDIISAVNRNILKLNDKIKKLERSMVNDDQSYVSGATSIHPIDNFLASR